MTELPLTEPAWLGHIDHTADECIEVSADSAEVLFERLAVGFMLVVADPNGIEPRQSWTVRVEAEDREALLVRWLGELNFLHQCEHLVFAGFTVTSLSETELCAEVTGEPIDLGRHEILAEIKAVTFHHLRLTHADGVWRGRILFDM
jgi:SHS2 domain-containing protein